MADDADTRMWTSRARRWARAHPSAGQAAARPAARLRRFLGLRVRGGDAGRAGPRHRLRVRHCDRRHRLVAHNPVGHFFNSLHLWSVELFMAFMVIHLWGKFWMAAWRGRRALTWITGVVAFGASVVECFTGYLSQQNFDSQWIATNGKDAFNAAGIGAFFNVMNFGQMLLWHVVLMPIILVALVGAHVLLVRVRGSATRCRRAVLGATGPRARPPRAADAAPVARADPALRHPQGRHVATAIALRPGPAHGRRAVLAGRAAGRVQSWARSAPADFLAPRPPNSPAPAWPPPTARRTTTAPPRAAGGTGQLAETVRRHPAHQRRPGLRRSRRCRSSPRPARAGRRAHHLHSAPPAQQQKWATAYGNAVTKVKFVNGTPVVPQPATGPCR